MSYQKTYLLKLYIYSTYNYFANICNIKYILIFLLIYLFPCIFININVASGHSVNKKNHFGCLHHHRYIHNDSDDSPHPILSCCIECSRILKPLCISQLTHFHQPLCHFNIYSPQSTSSTLSRYSVFIPLRKNTEMARRMASESL